MTPGEASAKAADLADLKELQRSRAWVAFVVPKLEKQRDTHLAASTAKGSTPTARAEHIEAYHLAVDLLELVPGRIATLTKELRTHEQKGGVAGQSGDALADAGS